MRKTIGWSLTALGILMVAAALAIAGVYLAQQKKAGDSAEAVMEELLLQIQSHPTQSVGPEQSSPTVPADPTLPDCDEVYKPMPEVVIDGVAYIGYLEIPALGLTLPVIGESTPDNLDIAPCRYYGSVYGQTMVIGAHSYARHFGYLASLSYGDRVIFTDVEGNVFTYEFMDMERLQPYEGEYLCSPEWDLSLYTCTTGGGARITVRCERVE